MNRVISAFAVGVFVCTAAAAQEPYHGGNAITLIVPYSPGGSTDTGMRLLVPGLERQLGTSIDVKNVNGGGGQVGITEFVRTAKPDGMTLATVGMPTVLTQYTDPARSAIYDREDFTSVGGAWSGAYGVAVPADSEIDDLAEFVDIGTSEPGKLLVGDSGLMAGPHLMFAMFQSKTGTAYTSVHLDGGSGAQTALLGGHVDAMVGGAGDFGPLVANGKVRVLGVAAEGAPDALPDAPTMTEAGVPFVYETMQSLAVPAGTPPEIVATLEAALKGALEDPQVIDGFKSYGNTPDFTPAAEFETFWKTLDDELAPVVLKLLEENAG